MPEKKGDPERPIIPIHIGAHSFNEAICDLGASVNIMPKVIYEKIHGPPLLYTTMCLQLADQMLCYPMGILENIWVVVGQSSLRVDFVVIETGGDERARIILGRPFLSTAKAIIYTIVPRSISPSERPRTDLASRIVRTQTEFTLRERMTEIARFKRRGTLFQKIRSDKIRRQQRRRSTLMKAYSPLHQRISRRRRAKQSFLLNVDTS